MAALQLKQIDNPRQLVWNRKYLCGAITSGDHPIQWSVYKCSGNNSFADPDTHKVIPDDETEMLFDVGVVYELPQTYYDLQE